MNNKLSRFNYAFSIKKFLLAIRNYNTDRKAISIALLIIMLFFVAKWTFQGAFFVNDLVTITIPLENLYGQIQQSGQSPLWAPELAGGYPLLAIGQLGFWYPLHMLLRQFLPGVWTLNLSMMLHAMLAFAGTFLFLRHNKVNTIATCTAALLLPLGATFVGKYEMINLVLPFMWAPLIFLFLHIFMEHGKLQPFLFWIGSNVLCVLVGHPQMTVYVFLMEAIFVLCLTGLRWQRWARALMTLLGVGLIIGLTSFYLLPITDNISATDRAMGYNSSDSESIYEFKFSPAALTGLFLPHPFGHNNAYKGPKNESELSCYLGPVALGLALLGLFTGRKKFPVVWWLSLLLSVVGLILAIGDYSPVFKWIVNHGWKYFNCPSRFIFYTHIGLVLLVAMGLDFCLSNIKHKESIISKIITALLVVGTIVPVLWVSWTWYQGVPWKYTDEPTLAKLLRQENGLIRIVAKEGTSDIAPDNDFGVMVGNPICSKCLFRQSFASPFNTINGIAIKLSTPTSENGILTLTLYTNDGNKIRESTLPTQKIIDSDWNNFTFQPIEDAENKAFYFDVTSDLKKQQAPRLIIHSNPAGQYNPSGTLSSCAKNVCKEIKADTDSVDSAFKVIVDSNGAVRNQEGLSPYVSAGYGINSAFWTGSLPILDVSNYMSTLRKGEEYLGNNSRSITNRFPVTHVIGLYAANHYDANLDDFSLLASAPLADQFLRLYKNNQAFPRLQFAQTVKAVTGSANQKEYLLQLDSKDQKTVVVDVKQDSIFNVSGNTAQIIRDDRAQVIIQTEQNTEGFIVLRDVLLKGWEATIDGHSTQIYRTDGIFRGIFVPAGKHTISFQYKPKWIKPVLYIESVAIISLLALIVLAYKQQKSN